MLMRGFVLVGVIIYNIFCGNMSICCVDIKVGIKISCSVGEMRRRTLDMS